MSDLIRECRKQYGDAHDAHMAMNGECPWCGSSTYNQDPFIPVPEGWHRHTENGVECLMHDDETLGELGCIAYDMDMVGGYFLPGRSHYRPWPTLAEAVESAENGGRQ